MSSNQSPTGPDSIVASPQILKCSEKINELVEALSVAQGTFPAIPKDSEVKVYSKPPNRQLLYTYFYADLTAIIDATRPSLTKNGLSFTQDYTKHPQLGVGIATIIFHKSGQWLMTGFVPCSIQGMDMKAIAGQFTYGKRISLTAALGVSGDDDIDAGSIEAQQGNSTEKAPQQSKASPKPPGGDTTESKWDALRTDKMTPQQELMALVKEKNIPFSAMPEIIKKATGMEVKSQDLSTEEITKVIKYLNLISGHKGGANEPT